MTVTVDYLGADLDIKKPNCPRWKKSEMGLFTALFGKSIPIKTKISKQLLAIIWKPKILI